MMAVNLACNRRGKLNRLAMGGEEAVIERNCETIALFSQARRGRVRWKRWPTSTESFTHEAIAAKVAEGRKGWWKGRLLDI